MRKTRSQKTVRIGLTAAAALSALPALAQDNGQPAVPRAGGTQLEEQFRNPPDSARPRVWWHWMNGNITKDGIARDLAWMKRVGIGGVQTFDVNMSTPQIVDRRLLYMTPEWKDAFGFAAREADRLGIELAIASSPGWSETGGPWVPVQDGMKKLVWSETEIVGGKRFSGKLAVPPSATGPYQSLRDSGEMAALLGAEKESDPPKYYGDVAVLAVPILAKPTEAVPTVTDAEGKPVATAALTDADLNTSVELVQPKSGVLQLRLDYARPQTMRSVTLYMPNSASLLGGSRFSPRLEASDSGGRSWRKLADIPLTSLPTTVSFAATTARSFRIVFDAPQRGGAGMNFAPPAPGVDVMGMAGDFMKAAAAPPKPPLVGELILSGKDRIDRVEAKSGFTIAPDYYALSEGLPDAPGTLPDQVIDLTRQIGRDGTLDWTPPKGVWRIIRIGYSLTGATNHPAPREATGLEVDKYDGTAVRRYLEHYIGLYRDAVGAELIGKNGIRAILTDSIQVGAANWTPNFIAQFKRLRGYDPLPWLPAVTGTIIGSRAQSDRFLFDYRRTLGDLLASEHYGTVAAVARENGMLVYGEAFENGRPTLGDDMSVRRHADVPMAALWTFPREQGPNPAYIADMKGAASVAHVYGQNLVAAESLTAMLAPWAFGPRDLKHAIDLEFVTGINRPVIHTSVHAPADDKKPGLALGMFGQYFNRHESWAELARPWIDYIARNSLMLQQGRNFADVAYFYGEEAPLTSLGSTNRIADVPKSVAYDFVNADIVTGSLKNEGSDLVTSGGARYRVLYLGGSSRQMTLPTLKKIAALVEGGATVIGLRPIGDPGMAGSTAEFDAIASRLWSGGESSRVGMGVVVASQDIEAALRRSGIAPDFRYQGGAADSEILFSHRRLDDGDSYFLTNRKDRAETIEAHFRVTGKAPELWRPETGTSEPLNYRQENGETIVPLKLAGDDAAHIVFRKPTQFLERTVKRGDPVVAKGITSPWQVAFEPGRGAPQKTVLPTLVPLDENPDPSIKYFSGLASYSTEFVAPRNWHSGQPLLLDLGEVREIAEISVNGQLAGYVWRSPYRLDIGPMTKPGRNRMQVRVANLWVNRLIGDRQPGAQAITWTSQPTYMASAPLRRSGLIGPVNILMEK